MRVGMVIDGTKVFLRPIETELRRRHQVDRFSPRFVRLPLIGSRVNEWLLNQQLQGFMQRHDVVFSEWAASLLVKMTSLPKKGRIVTRLHSVEVATAAHLVDWSQVDATIVVSEHMKGRLLEVAQPPPAALHVVNYGIDLARFQPVVRTFQHRLGMVCSVLPIKRVYETVLCVSELRRRGHPFTLDVVGRLDSEQAPRYPWALLELVEKLGLGDDVTFHGYRDDVAQYYQNMDIFLSNSYWEGQQNALLEAMASGCYCLSHCWGGVEEVLPTENTFVSETDLITKLLVYASLRETEKRQLQAQMRTIAEERFDEGRMVREISSVIDGVAAS